jgi:hypothetical protein
MTKKKSEKKTVFDFRTIKTVEDAFKKCGYDSSILPDVSRIPEKFQNSLVTAYLLMVVFDAINDGWEPDFANHGQAKYFPWAWLLSSGFGFSYSGYCYDYTHACVGSRLCTDTSEKAIYVLEQFPALCKSWFLNVKSE